MAASGLRSGSNARVRTTLARWDDRGNFMWLEQPLRFFDTVGAWLDETIGAPRAS